MYYVSEQKKKEIENNYLFLVKLLVPHFFEIGITDIIYEEVQSTDSDSE